MVKGWLCLNVRVDLQLAVVIKRVSLCLVSTEKQKSAPAKQNIAVNSSSRNHSATVIPLPLSAWFPRCWHCSAAGRALTLLRVTPTVPSGCVLGAAGPAPLFPAWCLAPPNRGLAVPLHRGGGASCSCSFLVTFITVIGFSARRVKSVSMRSVFRGVLFVSN